MHNKTYKIFLLSTFTLVFLLDLFLQIGIFSDNLFYSGKTIFSDLVVIIPTVEELSNWNLFDFPKKSSTELFNRPMNYPVVWVYIFNFLSLFGNPAIILGSFQVILYLFCSYIFLLKTNKNFLVFFLIIFSPPFLLMMERGNIDCIIFFLLFLSILSNNYLSGFLLGLTIGLKIYPILLLPLFIFFKKFNFKFSIGILISLPIIIWTLMQLKILIISTPISFSTSFGIFSTALLIIKLIEKFLLINVIKDNYLYFYIITLFIFIFLSLIFKYLFKDDLIKILNVLKKNELEFKIFIIFSSLSVMIFIVFSNWAYRIIFLLPSALIYIKNLQAINNLFSKRKNLVYFMLITIPYLSPWIVSTFDKNLILLNYHSWALYSFPTFLSFIFYFAILLIFYLEQIKYIKLIFR